MSWLLAASLQGSELLQGGAMDPVEQVGEGRTELTLEFFDQQTSLVYCWKSTKKEKLFITSVK